MNSSNMQDIGLSSSSSITTTDMIPPKKQLKAVDKYYDKNKKIIIKKAEYIKRPDGMHRELFNLLVHQGKEECINSIIPSNTKKGYTAAKAKLGLRKTRKWYWKLFVNPARKDNLKLCHWEREDAKPDKVYPFARLNKTMDPIIFSNSEYEEYLQDPKWTKEETTFLLDLCHRFDLRWPIIQDRFETANQLANNKKTMEDMKERYYNLCRELFIARGQQSVENLTAFDGLHETRRKEQLIKLWNRTEEEIREEEELKLALKRIESKRKERERKAYDLQRLINATERTSISPDNHSTTSSGGGTTTSGGQRGLRKNKTKTTQAAAVQLIAPTDTMNIRYHEFRSSGPHLRSQEMKLPSNLGQKKHKNIDTVIEKLKLDPIPYAYEDLVEIFNNFRSNIVLLQDLKTALNSAEEELNNLNVKMKEERGYEIKIEPRMRISCSFSNDDSEKIRTTTTTGTNSKASQQQQGQLACSNRRISQLIDINPGGLTTARNRNRREATSSRSTTSTTSTISNTTIDSNSSRTTQ